MRLILTHTNGDTFTMPWRPEGRSSYSNTAASFLYNLNRAARADWTITTEDGRRVSMNKACAAAAEEMNAIRHGRRIPPVPQF